jgi:hypothetical protein
MNDGMGQRRVDGDEADCTHGLPPVASVHVQLGRSDCQKTLATDRVYGAILLRRWRPPGSKLIRRRADLRQESSRTSAAGRAGPQHVYDDEFAGGIEAPLAATREPSTAWTLSREQHRRRICPIPNLQESLSVR